MPMARSIASCADLSELDLVHLGGVGEDVGELSANCGWGFSAVGFQPRQCNISVGQPRHEVRRSRHVSNFCTKSSLGSQAKGEAFKQPWLGNQRLHGDPSAIRGPAHIDQIRPGRSPRPSPTRSRMLCSQVARHHSKSGDFGVRAHLREPMGSTESADRCGPLAPSFRRLTHPATALDEA